MPRPKYIEALRGVVSSNAAIFLAAACLTAALVDPVRMGVSRVNHLAMPLDYLLDFSAGEAPFDHEKFIDQLLYYQAIDRNNPGKRLPDLYGLIGFCYFYLQDLDKAEHYYEKAVLGNKNFFWNQHNLAVVYYLKGKYALAARHAQAALSCDLSLIAPAITSSPLLHMARNLVYYSRVGDDGVGLDIKRLYSGQQQMHQVRILSLSRLEKPQLTSEDVKMQGWLHNYHLGLIFLKQGDEQRAGFLFLRTIEEQPQLKDVYAALHISAPAQGFTMQEYFQHYPFKIYIY